MNKQTGFTLIELGITIVIVGILATVAIVYHQGYIRKSRRADAIRTLLAIQLEEESYRTQNLTYGNLTQVWSGVATSSNGFYNLAISAISSTGYTVTATATGDQTNDAEDGAACSTLTLTVNGNNDTSTPAACW